MTAQVMALQGSGDGSSVRPEVVEQAERDLIGVRGLRAALRERLGWKRAAERTVEGEVEFVRDHMDYLSRQERILASLLSYRPLYRLSRELVNPRFTVRAFYSASGSVFTAIDGEGDDVLVSWAHPIFAALRNSALGERVHLDGRVAYRVVAGTTVEDEEKAGDLRGVRVYLPGATLPVRVERVSWDAGGRPRVVAAASPSTVVTKTPAAAEVVSNEGALSPAVASRLLDLFSDDDSASEGSDVRKPLPPQRTFGLSSIAGHEDGRSLEIPFALDAVQYQVLTSKAAKGTIVILGPPGTGKTTIALLRATLFRHSLLEYDDRGRARTEGETQQPPAVRVFVVTEHLTSYLKEFLSSRESALPDARVICLRGAFIEEFLRESFFRKWLGMPKDGGSGPKAEGAWFHPENEKTNDVGHSIKAHARTLALCYEKALERVRGKSADGWKSLLGSIEKAALRPSTFDVYREVLGADVYQETTHGVTANEERLKRLEQQVSQRRKGPLFEAKFKARTEALDRHVRSLRSFMDDWLKKLAECCDLASQNAERVPLGPGSDDLLLGRFAGALTTSSSETLDTAFVAETWARLERLIDPRFVLHDVVTELERAAPLDDLGLQARDVAIALRVWRARLEDRDRPFMRSDFPLIASLARTFYACPPQERSRPALSNMQLGFHLPGGFVRYDHVIVDEGQDFTLAELLLTASFVDPARSAVTVSGDPRQRMHWRSGLRSLEALPVEQERKFSISMNYRQTRDISHWLRELSRRLFPTDTLVMELPERRGPPPETRSAVGGLEACVAAVVPWIQNWYSDNRQAFVAALTIGFDDDAIDRIADQLGRGLQSSFVLAEVVPDGRLIEPGRVAVSNVPTVKGLEFDGVVVLVSESASTALDRGDATALVLRNQLYVAASRAKRWLGVVTQSKCSLLEFEPPAVK